MVGLEAKHFLTLMNPKLDGIHKMELSLRVLHSASLGFFIALRLIPWYLNSIIILIFIETAWFLGTFGINIASNISKFTKISQFFGQV